MADVFAWSTRVVHGDSADLPIRRIRRGRGFAYHYVGGDVVRKKETLSRIATLAIPPAWEDVRIASNPEWHIQAIGRDQRKRRQYRYHPRWIEKNKRRDFDRLAEFGAALPVVRTFVDQQLRRRQMDKERVTGIALHLLDKALIRVGNDRYSDENGSFGLTTLRDSHVKSSNRSLDFNFIGKGGAIRKFSVNDPRAARAVRACHELPGYRLLQYIDDEGERHPLTSTDINERLAELCRKDFTAKTFRSWGATTDFHQRVYGTELPDTEHQRTQALNEALRATAKVLGNTLAVCRKYYVHPRMIDGYLAGKLAQRGRRLPARKGLSEAESDALRFLES